MMTTTKIDPYNITNYNRTEEELQLFLLFCIVVAGKTAYIQADKLEQFLDSINTRLMMPKHTSPFHSLISAEQHGILLQEIHKAKLGQYKKIYAAFLFLVKHQLSKFHLKYLKQVVLQLLFLFVQLKSLFLKCHLPLLQFVL